MPTDLQSATLWRGARSDDERGPDTAEPACAEHVGSISAFAALCAKAWISLVRPRSHAIAEFALTLALVLAFVLVSSTDAFSNASAHAARVHSCGRAAGVASPGWSIELPLLDLGDERSILAALDDHGTRRAASLGGADAQGRASENASLSGAPLFASGEAWAIGLAPCARQLSPSGGGSSALEGALADDWALISTDFVGEPARAAGAIYGIQQLLAAAIGMLHAEPKLSTRCFGSAAALHAAVAGAEPVRGVRVALGAAFDGRRLQPRGPTAGGGARQAGNGDGNGHAATGAGHDVRGAANRTSRRSDPGALLLSSYQLVHPASGVSLPSRARASEQPTPGQQRAPIPSTVWDAPPLLLRLRLQHALALALANADARRIAAEATVPDAQTSPLPPPPPVSSPPLPPPAELPGRGPIDDLATAQSAVLRTKHLRASAAARVRGAGASERRAPRRAAPRGGEYGGGRREEGAAEEPWLSLNVGIGVIVPRRAAEGSGGSAGAQGGSGSAACAPQSDASADGARGPLGPLGSGSGGTGAGLAPLCIDLLLAVRVRAQFRALGAELRSARSSAPSLRAALLAQGARSTAWVCAWWVAGAARALVATLPFVATAVALGAVSARAALALTALLPIGAAGVSAAVVAGALAASRAPAQHASAASFAYQCYLGLALIAGALLRMPRAPRALRALCFALPPCALHLGVEGALSLGGGGHASVGGADAERAGAAHGELLVGALEALCGAAMALAFESAACLALALVLDSTARRGRAGAAGEYDGAGVGATDGARAAQAVITAAAAGGGVALRCRQGEVAAILPGDCADGSSLLRGLLVYRGPRASGGVLVVASGAAGGVLTGCTSRKEGSAESVPAAAPCLLSASAAPGWAAMLPLGPAGPCAPVLLPPLWAELSCAEHLALFLVLARASLPAPAGITPNVGPAWRWIRRTASSVSAAARAFADVASATREAAQLDVAGSGPPGTTAADVRALLRLVGLQRRGGVPASALSDGERSRLALACALASLESGAKVLLLDDPTARLDRAGRALVMGLLHRAASGERFVPVRAGPGGSGREAQSPGGLGRNDGCSAHVSPSPGPGSGAGSISPSSAPPRRAVVVVTHDDELAAILCSSVLHLRAVSPESAFSVGDATGGWAGTGNGGRRRRPHAFSLPLALPARPSPQRALTAHATAAAERTASWVLREASPSLAAAVRLSARRGALHASAASPEENQHGGVRRAADDMAGADGAVRLLRRARMLLVAFSATPGAGERGSRPGRCVDAGGADGSRAPSAASRSLGGRCPALLKCALGPRRARDDADTAGLPLASVAWLGNERAAPAAGTAACAEAGSQGGAGAGAADWLAQGFAIAVADASTRARLELTHRARTAESALSPFMAERNRSLRHELQPSQPAVTACGADAAPRSAAFRFGVRVRALLRRRFALAARDPTTVSTALLPVLLALLALICPLPDLNGLPSARPDFKTNAKTSHFAAPRATLAAGACALEALAVGYAVPSVLPATPVTPATRASTDTHVASEHATNPAAAEGRRAAASISRATARALSSLDGPLAGPCGAGAAGPLAAGAAEGAGWAGGLLLPSGGVRGRTSALFHWLRNPGQWERATGGAQASEAQAELAAAAEHCTGAPLASAFAIEDARLTPSGGLRARSTLLVRGGGCAGERAATAVLAAMHASVACVAVSSALGRLRDGASPASGHRGLEPASSTGSAPRGEETLGDAPCDARAWMPRIVRVAMRREPHVPPAPRDVAAVAEEEGSVLAPSSSPSSWAAGATRPAGPTSSLAADLMARSHPGSPPLPPPSPSQSAISNFQVGRALSSDHSQEPACSARSLPGAAFANSTDGATASYWLVALSLPAARAADIACAESRSGSRAMLRAHGAGVASLGCSLLLSDCLALLAPSALAVAALAAGSSVGAAHGTWTSRIAFGVSSLLFSGAAAAQAVVVARAARWSVALAVSWVVLGAPAVASLTQTTPRRVAADGEGGLQAFTRSKYESGGSLRRNRASDQSTDGIERRSGWSPGERAGQRERVLPVLARVVRRAFLPQLTMLELLLPSAPLSAAAERDAATIAGCAGGSLGESEEPGLSQGAGPGGNGAFAQCLYLAASFLVHAALLLWTPPSLRRARWRRLWRQREDAPHADPQKAAGSARDVAATAAAAARCAAEREAAVRALACRAPDMHRCLHTCHHPEGVESGSPAQPPARPPRDDVLVLVDVTKAWPPHSTGHNFCARSAPPGGPPEGRANEHPRAHGNRGPLSGFSPQLCGREVAGGVHGASLCVRAGESVAVVGPNGAGKSTLLMLAAGVLEPCSGMRALLGSRHSSPEHARSGGRGDEALPGIGGYVRVGYAPQREAGDDELSVLEAILICASLRSARPFASAALQTDVSDMLRSLGLQLHSSRRIGALSSGLRQRLSLACALVGAPQLLILDEPTSRLDPPAAALAWRAIDCAAARGTAVLFAAHSSRGLAAAADRTVVLHSGDICDVGPPSTDV